MEKIRFLLIGVGAMGRLHLRRLRANPDVEIAGLVNRSPEAITLARKLFPDIAQAPAWSDYQTALREAGAHAALIATPHADHFEQGMACLDSGLHVLMEKPFADSRAHAEALAERAVQRQRHMAVSYQYRLEGMFRHMRNLIQEGELGTVGSVSAYQAQNWLRSTSGSWRQQPERSCGGQLNDSGSHLLDLVLWMTGLAPEQVWATLSNHGAEVEADAALTVRLQGGALACFSIVGSASINWWVDLTVHGDKGSLLYRNGKLLLARAGERVPKEIEPKGFPATSDPDQDFVDLLMGRCAEPSAPPASGVQIARLTEAAYESHRLGQPVQV
ncbi:MAG: Gfo/Idh/MocA family oxidoreductase [Roseiflexaceae bacterium]